MRTRSFSLSKVVPVEIINLVIQESSDSNSTLLAWCLVSLGCLCVAGPLLNERVHISDDSFLVRVLERMTFDGDDPHLLPFPRLLVPLSLHDVKRLTIDFPPHIYTLEDFCNSVAPSQRRRRLHLDLDMGWGVDDSEPSTSSVYYSNFLAPKLIKILQPGSLTFPSEPGASVRLTSWTVQTYLNAISLLPDLPLDSNFGEDPLIAQTLAQYGRSFSLASVLQVMRDSHCAAIVRTTDLFAFAQARGMKSKLRAEGPLEDLRTLKREFEGGEEKWRLEIEEEAGRFTTVAEVFHAAEKKVWEWPGMLQDPLEELLERHVAAARAEIEQDVALARSGDERDVEGGSV